MAFCVERFWIVMANKIDWSSVFNQFDKLAEQVKQLDDNIDRFNNATKQTKERI